MLVVADLERSVRFYSERLGLVVRYATLTWVELDGGNIRLALHLAEGDVRVGPTTGCTFAFYVDDLLDTIDRLKDGGIRVVHKPHREAFGGMLAAISDPDGYRVHLVEIEPDVGELRSAIDVH